MGLGRATQRKRKTSLHKQAASSSASGVSEKNRISKITLYTLTERYSTITAGVNHYCDNGANPAAVIGILFKGRNIVNKILI